MGNFLFKVITKFIATGFGGILDSYVSMFQFGFIPGKSIQTCIALASEAFNDIQSTPSSDGMLLKIDIQRLLILWIGPFYRKF